MNPQALGRAFRTGGLRNSPLTKSGPKFLNFFALGRWFTPPPPLPGVPKSLPLDPPWSFLAPKTCFKKHIEKQPKTNATKHPRMTPKWSQTSMKFAPRQKKHQKQHETYTKTIPKMDSKLAKNNPGALSAVFQKTMCHLPKHYLLSFGPPRGHFKRDLKSYSEFNTFFPISGSEICPKLTPKPTRNRSRKSNRFC